MSENPELFRLEYHVETPPEGNYSVPESIEEGINQVGGLVWAPWTTHPQASIMIPPEKAQEIRNLEGVVSLIPEEEVDED